MTCQHCQTWILDDDHRCRRCGRRVRSAPPRISPNTYPIAATATAPAYDFEPPPQGDTVQNASSEAAPGASEQQVLFANTASDPRVIPFDSLTSEAERQSIRARAAGVARPAPLKAEKVQLRRPRAKRQRAHSGQQDLDFFRQSEVPSQPQSHIICDAPVAPMMLRVQATVIDVLLVLTGCAMAAAVFKYMTDQFALNTHMLLLHALALGTIPFFYKFSWTFAGLDSIGMQLIGLRLVDFDGNPPSRARRYQRLVGGFISLSAAGIGLIWAFVDEDRLTWHDHISSTFPTVALEN